MSDKEIEKDIDSLSEIVLKQIANVKHGYHHAMYPYFALENGTHIEDIGVNPKRVAEHLIRHGLAKPLVEEKCELTELGIKIGQGIGFKKYKTNLFGLSSQKEIEEKERQKTKDKIDILTLDNLRHTEKIREQEDNIRNLTEQLTRINLLKAYWWVIGIGFTIGGIIGGILVKLL